LRELEAEVRKHLKSAPTEVSLMLGAGLCVFARGSCARACCRVFHANLSSKYRAAGGDRSKVASGRFSMSRCVLQACACQHSGCRVFVKVPACAYQDDVHL